MSTAIVQVLILAALSDNRVDVEEAELIKNFQQFYPTMRDWTQEDFDNAVKDVLNKKELGMRDNQQLENLEEGLSESKKNTIYALAVEVCASNFEIVPPENDFLNCLETQWKIKKKIIEAVRLSSQLRYSVS